MHSLKLCQKYLAAVNERNLDQIASFFAPGATVISPIITEAMNAWEFHTRLFEDMQHTVTKTKAVFASVNSVSSIALYFSHTWILNNGTSLNFDGVNIFDLTPDGTQFTKLTIICDTAAIRPHLAEMQRYQTSHGKWNFHPFSPAQVAS
jgi:hypothetical protein